MTKPKNIRDSAEAPPSQLSRDDFVSAYGGVFEHSPWIAEQAYDAGLDAANDTADGLHDAMKTKFQASGEDKRLAVLNAHPDLAGKLAAANRLTTESTSEQAGAGLDSLTDEEHETFTRLNTQYVEKFGFPYIIAVKGLAKADILASFKTRIDNTRDIEFATACLQVERIALLRLKDLLP